MMKAAKEKTRVNKESLVLDPLLAYEYTEGVSEAVATVGLELATEEIMVD